MSTVGPTPLTHVKEMFTGYAEDSQEHGSDFLPSETLPTDRIEKIDHEQTSRDAGQESEK